MDEKPGFRSYLGQFSVVSYKVKDTGTGVIYEEVGAKTHRILWTAAFIIIFGLIIYFLISSISLDMDALICAIYIIGAFLLAAVYYIFSIWALYRMSSFDVLGEEEVNKFIEIKNDIF